MMLHHYLAATGRTDERELRRAMSAALESEIPHDRPGYERFYRRVLDELETASQRPIEYRFWVMPRGFQVLPTIRIERIGLAVFYDVGTVADGFSALGSAEIHDSYGLSLRITLERKALFRVDVGISDEDVNVTGSYGLSF